ncbi:MAG: hypothetical protein AB7D51_04535 [Desulfovibrionaceae bacterium]|jgi:hypothetical protein
MSKVDKNVLQVAKEVVIKFIEMGRISPTNFGETFQDIYTSVQSTIYQGAAPDDEGDDE